MQVTPSVSRALLKKLHAYLQAIAEAEANPTSPMYNAGAEVFRLPDKLPIIFKTSSQDVIEELVSLRIEAKQGFCSEGEVVGKLLRRLPQFEIDMLLIEADDPSIACLLARLDLEDDSYPPATVAVIDKGMVSWKSDERRDQTLPQTGGKGSADSGTISTSATEPLTRNSYLQYPDSMSGDIPAPKIEVPLAH